VPIIWEDSRVDKLSGLHGKTTTVETAVTKIRDAINPLINPDAAKILVAIAADVWSGVEARNDLRDVKAASAALNAAIRSLEAVTSTLDG
jgi:hypothetical protein